MTSKWRVTEVRELKNLKKFLGGRSEVFGLFIFVILVSIVSPASSSIASDEAPKNACSVMFSALLRQMQGLHPKDQIVGRSRELTQLESLLEANKNVLLAGTSGSGKTTLLDYFIREYQQNRLENFKPGSLVFAQFKWRDASLIVRDGSPIAGGTNFTEALNNLVESSSGKKIVLHIPDFDVFLLELQRRPDFNLMALQLKDLMASKKIQIVGELSGRLSKDAFKDLSPQSSPLSIEEMIRIDSPFKDFFETLDLAPLSGDQMILAMSLEAARVTKETGISFDTNALKSILTLAGNEFNHSASILKDAKNLLNQIALERSRALKSNSNFALSRTQRDIEEAKANIRNLEGVNGLEETLASEKARLEALEAKRDSALEMARKESSAEAPVTEIRDRIQELENQIALEMDAGKRLDLQAELRAKKIELEAALKNVESTSKPSHISANIVTQWASDFLGRDISFSPKDFDSLLRKLKNNESSSEGFSITEFDQLDVTFDDVIGHQAAKDAIRRVRQKLEHLELAKETGTDSAEGILLYGPPGTGKSLYLKAAARELGAAYAELRAAGLYSKWVGESEANILAFWKQIQERGKSGERILIAADEADSLFKMRGSGSNSVEDRVVNITLEQLQRTMDMKLPNLVIVLATNRPELIDSAMKRPGRLNNEIYFGLPERAAREDLLAKSFEKYEARLPQNWRELMKDLAQEMEGWSAAEIAGFGVKVREYVFEELVKMKEEGRSLDNWRISSEKIQEIFGVLKQRFPATSQVELNALLNYRDRNAQNRKKIDDAEPGSLMGQE